MDWEKIFSWIALFRIILAVIGLSSAFFSGVILIVGWEFFTIINKTDIFSFVSGIVLVLIVMISILWNFLRHLLNRRRNIEGFNLDTWLKTYGLPLSIGFSSVLIMILISLLFFPAEDSVKVVVVHFLIWFGWCCLFLGFILSFFVLIEGGEFSLDAWLGIASMLLGSLILGMSWVFSSQVSSRTTQVFLKSEKLSDKLLVNILFPAGQGILVYVKGQETPTYIPWSSIRKMEVIKGAK